MVRKSFFNSFPLGGEQVVYVIVYKKNKAFRAGFFKVDTVKNNETDRIWLPVDN
jgi:hypothetical protein